VRATSVRAAGDGTWGTAVALRAVVVCAAGALVSGACMETRRSLGEECLKDSDCLSGVCAQLVCVAAPSTTDTPAIAEAGSGGAAEDAVGTGAPDASAADDGQRGSEQDDVVETREGAATDGTMDSDGSGD
jgi:hypothetical protein